MFDQQMDLGGFLNKLFNPGGPTDLATGQRAAPTGMDVLKGVGKGLGGAAAFGAGMTGAPTADLGGLGRAMGMQPERKTGDLNAILAALKQQQGGGGAPAPASPLEQLMQRLFGMKPTNPVAPGMAPTQPNTQLPSAGIQGGTGGLY